MVEEQSCVSGEDGEWREGEWREGEWSEGEWREGEEPLRTPESTSRS